MMDSASVRKMQLLQLEMAKKVDKLCREHGITYWLASGNLLGAVRYGKFIPWDDDLDFCFPGDNFHKARELIRKELLPENPHYILYNDYRPANFGEYLADTRWLFDGFYPVKIDLLRFKAIEDSPAAIHRDQNMVNLLAFMYNKRAALDVDDTGLIEKHLKSGRFLFKRERFMEVYNEYLDSGSQLDSSRIFTFDYNDIFSRVMRGVYTREYYYSYEELFPVRDIEFDGHTFYAPNNVDVFLTKIFGKGYITPPPENQQKPVSKSFRKAFFPRAAKYYLRILYILKAIKGSFTLHFRIRKLKL